MPRPAGLSTLLVLVCGLLTASIPARADQPKPDFKQNRPGILDKAQFIQKPGVALPRDLVFQDEVGKDVRLGDFFAGDRPVILNFVYYDCPLLCNQVLDSLVRVLNVIRYKVGEDFDVVSISINPGDTPESARQKKASIISQYTGDAETARAGWHFLTGPEDSLRRAADAAGFRYSYSPSTKQFAHPAGIILVTPQGKISRYIYGLSYPARDLNLGLAESSEGKIGSILEQAQLLCYVYDPESGSYSFAIMTVLQVFGTLTALLLFGFIAVMLRRDRLQRRLAPGSATPPPPGTATGPPPVPTN
jgi:protein SCO1/2